MPSALTRLRFYILLFPRILACGWLVVLVHTSSAFAAPNPVVLDPGIAKHDLAGASYILDEPGRQLDFDTVRNPIQAESFILRKPSVGFTTAAFWIRFTVSNPSDNAVTWWFDTGNRTLQEVDLYAPDAQGHYAHQSASSNRPFAQRPLRTATFVFPIELPAQQTVNLYLRVRSSTSALASNVRPALWQPDDYREDALSEQVEWLIYLGACITLALLNLMFWAYLRDVQYGLYIASLLSLFVVVSFANGSGGYGAGYEMLFPNSPTLHRMLCLLGPSAGITVPIYFMMRLLNINKIAPRLTRIVMLFGVGIWASILLVVFEAEITSYGLDALLKIAVLAWVLCVVSILNCTLIATFIAIRASVPLAWYVVVAFMPFGLDGAAAATFVTLGRTVPPEGLLWASIFEFFVMALALAERFYQERMAKITAQAEVIETLRRSERELEGKVQQRTAELANEQERTQGLLRNILPEHVIRELASTGKVKPMRHEGATILFTDLAGFTQATSTMPADRMVEELNDIFAGFDEIAHDEGVEKIKTIGDAYMAAAGLTDHQPDHAQRCARAALRMQTFIEERNRGAAFKWLLRVGIHSGPVISGVVGQRKYAFDIWGDAVNIASRMESAGETGRVNVSAYTYDLIRSFFDCTYRGKITAKGKGEVDMYFVDAAKGAIVR